MLGYGLRPNPTYKSSGSAIYGQPALISQALANLLDNTFKYTPLTVPVEVRLYQENGQAVLAVIDHGEGIPTADHARMTERFTRGDAARGQAGSGLGLALVKAIAHAHSGTLELADTPGGGLIARIKLPLIKPRSVGQAQSGQTGQWGSGSRIRDQ